VLSCGDSSTATYLWFLYAVVPRSLSNGDLQPLFIPWGSRSVVADGWADYLGYKLDVDEDPTFHSLAIGEYLAARVAPTKLLYRFSKLKNYTRY
jgi:hypothetical protein